MQYTNIIPELIQRQEQFNSCMEDIKNYVNVIISQKVFLNEIGIHGSNEQKEFAEQMKNVDTSIPYRAIIISIYGNFENYIVDISKLLIEGKGKVYGSLNSFPDAVKENYITQCANFLSSPNRYSRYEIAKDDVFKSIFQSGNGFITDLATTHGGNFRIDQISELLKNVGISSPMAEIKASIVLRKFIEEEQDISHDKVGSYIESADNIFYQLDRLVEARNTVAHSWYIDDRIGLHDIMESTIPFIKCIADTIHDIAINDYLNVIYSSGRMKKFNPAIALYNNDILCVNSLDSRVEVKDFLLYQNGSETKLISVQIKNIRIDEKDIVQVDVDNVSIGMKLSKKVKKEGDFFYISKQE